MHKVNVSYCSPTIVCAQTFIGPDVVDFLNRYYYDVDLNDGSWVIWEGTDKVPYLCFDFLEANARVHPICSLVHKGPLQGVLVFGLGSQVAFDDNSVYELDTRAMLELRERACAQPFKN